MSEQIADILFDSVLNQPVAFEEGADPYASIPLPPEPGPQTFRVARQGDAHVRIRWSYKDADGKEKTVTARGSEEFHKAVREVYKLEDEGEVVEKARSLLADQDTKRCFSINLVIYCVAPGQLWDGSISYLEMTSDMRRGAKSSPLAYLASRLGHPVSQGTGADMIKFLDATIPEESVETSPIELSFKYRWSGFGRDSKGNFISVRGMNRWPKETEPSRKGLHKQELDHKDATEPIRASLEITGYE